MTPGQYLRLRREAAGLTIDHVAQLVVAPFGKLQLSARWLQEVEADRLQAEAASLDRLRGAFRFDPFIYRQLAADVPAPQLCRKCACSWSDPCVDENGPCAWASSPDLCTACARQSPTECALCLTAFADADAGGAADGICGRCIDQLAREPVTVAIPSLSVLLA